VDVDLVAVVHVDLVAVVLAALVLVVTCLSWDMCPMLMMTTW
jgi:hypothetical protein